MSTLDQARAEQGRRVALVIGVNGSPHYKDGDDLHFAVSDAKAMAQVLQEHCAFELLTPPLLGEDATSNKIKETLFDQALTLNEDDFLLVYFAGHGHAQYVEAERLATYLVSADFDKQYIERDEHMYISMHWLRDQLFIRTKIAGVLIILDCCHAGGIDKAASDHYLDELRQRLIYYFETAGGEVDKRLGSMHLALMATGYNQAAFERDGHGVLTGALLLALGGEVESVLDNEGQVTLHVLFSYLCRIMPEKQKPVLSGASSDCVLAWHPELARERQMRREGHYEMEVRKEKIERLRRKLADPGPVTNRLQWFVGRNNEFEDVCKKIAALRKTGVYLVITGEAGQGKSSLIAKLVEHYAQEQGSFDKVVYHLIPPRPQSNERAYLLRELLERLILKHSLSFAPDPFELADSIPQMEELFHLVLQELVDKQRQEIIFIDGLDQLADHEDDLSFLPDDPMPGIVFVLGTRPDTFSLLEGKKSEPYPLSGLSFDDFILLLEKHREKSKEQDLEKRRANEQGRDRIFSLILSKADLLYEKSKKYTLCLSVLARELYSQPDLIEHDVDEILTKINPNPEHVFDLTISRLEQGKAWDTVTKPLLKLLLFAEEALTLSQLTQLLRIASSNSIDSYAVEKELFGHLSGLVVQQYDIQQEDVSGYYTLDHVLLRNYLNKRFKNDLRDCHRYFVIWCEQDALPQLWEDSYRDEIQERRRYARHYYIIHLYRAYEWEKLFEVLYEGNYGQEKMREDPSGRSYSQDLTWGQDAAVSLLERVADPMNQLARLWHYAFLRCSLNSRADNYTETTFRLLLLLGEEQERKARELAEMLTSTEYKACIFVLITSHLASLPGRQQEAFPWALSSEQITENLPPDDPHKGDLQRKLAETLKRIGRIQKGEQIQQKALLNSPAARSHATEYEPSIKEFIPEWSDTTMQPTGFPEAVDEEQVMALLAACLMLQQGYWNGDELIWVEVEQLISTLPESIPKASLLTEFAFATEKIGRENAAGQIRWKIIEFLFTPGDEGMKDSVLRRLVETLELRGWRAETEQIWLSIEHIINDFSDDEHKENALARVASACARAGGFEHSWKIISTLPDENSKVVALADYLLCIRKNKGKNAMEARFNELADGAIKDAVRAGLGAGLDRDGFWPDAGPIIGTISDASLRCSAQLAHARLLQQRFFSVAQGILRDLPESADRRWALAALAVAWEKSKYRREAGQTSVGEGEQVIRTLPGGPQQVWALTELAAILAQAQQWDKAMACLQEAEEKVHTLSENEQGDPTFSERWQQARTHYACTLVRQRHWQQLEQVPPEIVRAASFIKELAELAQETAVVEDLDIIERLITQVVADATQTVPYNRKALCIYARLGAAWKRAGDVQKATSIWQRAEQLLSIAPLHERIKAVGVYARTLSETENNREAEHLWHETERVIRSLPEKQEDFLIPFATELVKAGRQQEALEVLRSLQSIWKTIQATAALGALSVKIGHHDQAGLLFGEAVACVKKVARNEYVQEILEEMQHLLAPGDGREQEDAIEHVLELARQLYRYGWREETKQQLRKLEDLIQRIPDKTRKQEALFKLIDAHGYIKNFPDINWIGEHLFSDIDKASFFAHCALVLAKTGRKAEANNIIDKIVDQSVAPLGAESGKLVLLRIKKQAQIQLLHQYWHMRDWKYAEATINTLVDEQLKEDARAKQAEILGRAYELDVLSSQSEQEKRAAQALLADARSVIDSIVDVWKKRYALITLSEHMAGTEELNAQARAICEEVEEKFAHETSNRTGPLSSRATDDEKKHWIELRARLGIAYERMGERYKAEQLLQEAEQDILSLCWGEQEDQALEQLATAFLQTRNWQLAQEVIDEIIDPTRKGRLLFDLASLLIEKRLWAQADEVARSIRDDQTIDDQPGKDRLFFNLTNLLIEEEQWAQADGAARSILDDFLREQALGNCNKAYAQALAKHANELAQAQRWQEAQDEINSINNQVPGDRATTAIKDKAFSDLSYSLTQVQRWQDAEKVISFIREATTKDESFCSLIDQLMKIKDWDEAERIAFSIEDQQERARMQQTIDKEREKEQAGDLHSEVKIDVGQPIQLEERTARPVPREREGRPPSNRRRVPSEQPETRQRHQDSERIQSLYKQWREATTRKEILEGFAPACTLITQYPELGTGLWDAFQRVRRFLEGVSQRAAQERYPLDTTTSTSERYEYL